MAPATDLPFVLPEALEVWFVPPSSTARSGRVQSVRPGPKGPLVKVVGVDDVDAAKALCGRELLARADDLPADWLASSDEVSGPVGMRVVDLKRGMLGEVVEVIETGANDVWVVEGPLGEVLLPVIDEVVLSIDADAREARVRLLPGLLSDEATDE